MSRRKILFLCTGNSIRSQMAEAWFRHLSSDEFEVFSAGVAASGIHPLTVEAMSEVGLDLAGQRSKRVTELPYLEMDYVVTLCGHAKEVCPAFPEKVEKEHWPIYDPISAAGSMDERMEKFREVREELKGRVTKLIERLKK